MDHLADAPIANILILAGVIFLAVGIFGRLGGFIGSIFGNIEAGKNSRVLAGVLGALLIVGGGWLHVQTDKSAASTSVQPSPVTNASTAPSAASGTSTATTVPPAVTPSPARDGATDKAATLRSSSAKPSVSSAAPTAPEPAAARESLPASPPPPVGDDLLVGAWTNAIRQQNTITKIDIARVGQVLDAHIWYDCNSAECDYGIHHLGVSGSTTTYDFTRGGRRYVGSLDRYGQGVVLLAIDILQSGTPNRWHQNRVLIKATAPDKVQSAFVKYFNAPGTKAFAMAPGSTWSYHIGKAPVDQQAQRALQLCQQRASGCRVILLNNDVAE